LRDLPRQLDVVGRLLAQKDYGAIRDHAHRMKGTSGTYRLNSIAEQLAQLERLAVDQDEKQIAALVDAISSQVQRKATSMESPEATHDTGKLGETNGR
jgi:HPt (histidine-containing phosphotransfer) domain-containing protein